MAEFSLAFDLTMGHEGVYSNDTHDLGGETFWGISRVHWPSVDIWPALDALKGLGFPALLRKRPASPELEVLHAAVRRFYKAHFWDRAWGDVIVQRGQAIAEELFDTGVNLGGGRATECLQIALNVLNRSYRARPLWPEVVEDDDFGPATLRALQQALTQAPATDVVHLYNVMNVKQGNHYVELTRQSVSKERYIRGWMTRVQVRKKMLLAA